MKKAKKSRILSCVIAVALILGITGTAFATTYYDRDQNYSISNLPPDGGVLWSKTQITHYEDDRYGYICPITFTSGTHFTCRIYKTSDHSTHVMDYLNVYPTTDQNYSDIYSGYLHPVWNGQMKFSNDETTKVETTGEYGIYVN